MKRGGGGVCQALSNSPGSTARACCPEGREKTSLPRFSREGRAHPQSGTYEPSWQAQPGVPPPIPEYPRSPFPPNQPPFNMTMAVTMPSNQGQAREHLKHRPNTLQGVTVRRLPAIPTITSLHARRWRFRPGHERPPGHTALRTLPRSGQIWRLLLVLRRQHGQRVRRGGSGAGHALPACGQDAQSLRYAIGLPGLGAPVCPRAGRRCRGCGRPQRGRGGRGFVGGEGRREPGAAAGGASVAAVPRRDGPKGRIEAACAHLTSPRCAAHGRGAPASHQGTRDLQVSREAGLLRFLSLPCLILLTPALFSPQLTLQLPPALARSPSTTPPTPPLAPRRRGARLPTPLCRRSRRKAREW